MQHCTGDHPGAPELSNPVQTLGSRDPELAPTPFLPCNSLHSSRQQPLQATGP